MIAKGQKLSDRYQILKTIGEGGMANVFLAYDTILERKVAVKVLRGDLASDEKFVRRFQREALSASSLSHENIVEVYDVGEDSGEYYIVMEFVEGKHLKNLLKKRGKLTLSEVIDIMLQVTSGLSVAHDSYIIHRDIKPQNIMILENGIVKITDFGIAVAMNSTQLTQTNSVMGSVHYLPPEQASGKGATLQSDIYSLGILMYELLTGKLPYRGDNAVEIALKHLKEQFPSVRNEISDIPQSVENIILKATAKNPKNRYADAREMHDDLINCLDPSRKNEEKIIFKYPENEYEDNKIMKAKHDSNVSKKESEEIVAKQITEGDLKSQNKLLITLAAIFTGIVVIITTLVLLLPYLTKGQEIVMPNVVNMAESEAIDIIQKEGFTVKNTITQVSDLVEDGKVIRTDPVANQRKMKGHEVTIYVSIGSNAIEIEDYTNPPQKVDYIKGLLEGKGIHVTIEKQDVDDDSKYDENEIIKQDVEAGTYLTPGDSITLYIPNIKRVYPDFTGYKVSEIIDFAKDYGVTVTFTDKEGNRLSITSSNASEYDDYSVIYQNRLEGTTIPSTKGTLSIKLDIESKECEEGLC